MRYKIIQMLDYIKRNGIEKEFVTYEDLISIIHFVDIPEDNTFGPGKEPTEFQRYWIKDGKKTDALCSQHYFIYKELPGERWLVKNKYLERGVVSYEFVHGVYSPSFESISEEEAESIMNGEYKEKNNKNNKGLKEELHNLINKYL